MDGHDDDTAGSGGPSSTRAGRAATQTQREHDKAPVLSIEAWRGPRYEYLRSPGGVASGRLSVHKVFSPALLGDYLSGLARAGDDAPIEPAVVALWVHSLDDASLDVAAHGLGALSLAGTFARCVLLRVGSGFLASDVRRELVHFHVLLEQWLMGAGYCVTEELLIRHANAVTPVLLLAPSGQEGGRECAQATHRVLEASDVGALGDPVGDLAVTLALERAKALGPLHKGQGVVACERIGRVATVCASLQGIDSLCVAPSHQCAQSIVRHFLTQGRAAT